MADFDEVSKAAKENVNTVIEETKEVFEEAKAAVTGQKLESDVVGSAGYREAESSGNGLAIASLVFGILSIVFSFVITWLGLICGIAGVIMGANARKMHQTSSATAGFVCSIVGIALSALFLVCALVCLGSLSSLASSM